MSEITGQCTACNEQIELTENSYFIPASDDWDGPPVTELELWMTEFHYLSYPDYSKCSGSWKCPLSIYVDGVLYE